MLRQRKVPKRKATRRLGPCAALRATCGARSKWGLAQTRCAQTSASPDPLEAALLGPASTGLGTSRAFAALGHQRRRALRSALGIREFASNLIASCAHPLCAKCQFHSKTRLGAQQRPVGLQNPLRLGRGAQGAAGCRASRGRRGLSERSEFRSRLPAPSTAGCPVAQRRGPRRRVAFSLLTFSWRSKRK